mmetsp:Transcript_29637/g.58597  ORF Transcript_29637/g.58597 Transcript_29637/m.58597 type:complete len:116 (-) Transcript_29637:329-676(-)
MVSFSVMQERFLGCLTALSNSDRLSAFRLLVQVGAEGMPAGEICKELDVKSSTMSSHLKLLLHANLVFRRREGRILRYYANMEEMNSLMGFLNENCCAGKPKRSNNAFAELEVLN